MTEDASVKNFIEDTWVRSLECREWIRRFDLCGIPHGWSAQQLEGLHELYQKITGYLLSQALLVDSDGARRPEKIRFHQKYGWVLASGSAKAYLGKVAMPDETPLEIGCQSYLSGHATLRGRHRLAIGKFTAIAEGLYLNTASGMHPTEYAAMINFSAGCRCQDEGLGMDISCQQLEQQQTGIEIGSDVWIGRDVRIFHGVQIAHGCVIAERSLVRGVTEPYGIYAGTPARLKRFRFDEAIVSALLKLEWWNWPTDRILRNQRFFSTNLKQFQGDVLSLIND